MFLFTKKFLVSLSVSFTVLFVFSFITFHTTPPVFAEVTFIQDVQLNYEIPGVEGKKINVTSIQRLQETFIKPFFNTLFGIGGIIAVLGIALGGLQYMGAGASIGNVKEGQAKIFNAIMGVVLLLSSFLLLRTINPQILGGVGGIGQCDGDAAPKEYSSLCPLPKFEQSEVLTKGVQQDIQKANQTNDQKMNDRVDKYKQEVKTKTADQLKSEIAELDTKITDAQHKAEEWRFMPETTLGLINQSTINLTDTERATLKSNGIESDSSPIFLGQNADTNNKLDLILRNAVSPKLKGARIGGSIVNGKQVTTIIWGNGTINLVTRDILNALNEEALQLHRQKGAIITELRKKREVAQQELNNKK